MTFFTSTNQKPKHYKKGALHGKKGFTLVELLVSISIFVFITALVMIKYSSFDSGVLLTNLAYDIALTIRQAQVFGLNVRQGPTQQFTFAYGAHFDSTSNGSPANNTTFLFFADTNDSLSYTPNVAEEQNVYSVKKNNKISALCATNNGAGTCDTSPVTSLDILFKRPNPDAYIIAAGVPYSYAKITIRAPDGSLKYIIVQKTGQISIQ